MKGEEGVGVYGSMDTSSFISWCVLGLYWPAIPYSTSLEHTMKLFFLIAPLSYHLYKNILFFLIYLFIKKIMIYN